MIRALVAVLLVAYLPGALFFRLPAADREKRAALAAEERVFWSVVLSLAWTLAVTLGLAAAGWYRFDRLLWIAGVTVAAMLAIGRNRLRLGPAAPRPTWTVLAPAALALLAAALTFHVPPAEYIMGGKDPGVYVNEGLRIARTGHLIAGDRTVVDVPPPFRDLFFPSHRNASYYSTRFMGFFLLDPERGTVGGQFPHLYPASVAVAHDIAGLDGARGVLGLWGVLGVVAVYFLGARLVGRTAAAAGAGLLAIHVVQVWYSRYPNAEIVLQVFVYAGLAAWVRATADDIRFFRPVAALLFVLTVFAHLTGVFVLAGVAAAAVLARFNGQRLPLSFAVPFVAGAAAGAWYFVTFLPAYSAMPAGFVRMLTSSQVAAFGALGLAGVVLWFAASRPAVAAAVRVTAPAALVGAVLLAAAYAYFLRVPQGALAPQDAGALRMFTAFYVSPLGLALGLVGLVVTARRSFWASAPFLVVLAVFSFVFFHKLRIIPEHFWAARRFLAVILPGLLVLAGAAAFAPLEVTGTRARTLRWARGAVGMALIAVLATTYVTATRGILRHVEYAGLIPRLEGLASRFSDNDLVLIESRNSSDIHVLALPLAYTYGRNVLVFPRPDPNKGLFRGFLDWAHTRYERVFFVGGGGTELLSRTTAIRAVAGERFQVPEYESDWDVYPTRRLFKEFEFGVYEFLRGERDAGPFDLDVGVADDLYVRRFFAKERHADGFTFRWTSNASYVSIVGFDAGCRAITMWMGHGRPTRAPSTPAEIEVTLEGRLLGKVTVGRRIQPYVFEVPADLAATLAASPNAARLQLVTTTWNPRAAIGGRDSRDIGVMIDRVAACASTSP